MMYEVVTKELWGEHTEELKKLEESFIEYIDKNYSEDYIFKEGEFEKLENDFFKENGTKEFYEYYKNFKPIENPKGTIIN